MIMKFKILHEIRGRLRIHILTQYSQDDFDRLYCALNANRVIKRCKVYPATNDLMIEYMCGRKEALALLCQTNPNTVTVPEHALTSVAAARELKRQYISRLVGKVAARYFSRRKVFQTLVYP